MEIPWDSHGDSHENGNEKQISMEIEMGMISVWVGVGLLENALWEKIPIDIKFKAK